jgi:hypothetical protein
VPFQPILRPLFGQSGDNTNTIIRLTLKITNIGPGVATDITVNYSVKNTKNTSQTEKIELLDPKALSRSLNLNHIPPITDRHYYSIHKIIISIKLNYKDIFGKRHRSKRELDANAEASL